MIVDSHCHLDYSSLYNQLDDVIKRAEYNQVKYLLTICTTLKSFETIKLITDKYENIYGTFGIHPHETKKFLNVDKNFILNSKKNSKKIKRNMYHSGYDSTKNYILEAYPFQGSI